LDVLNLHKFDVNWLGVPNQSYLDRIRNENFDITIDLNSHHDVLCTYLTDLIEAPMRLHLVEGKFDKIYNLHIRSKMESSIEKRYQNLVKYLANLRH
jgi:ADP-heptose:LPS heptosyltransferase